MKEYKLNNEQEFIQGYYISNNKITDDLIKYFEKSKDKREGVSSNGVDKSISPDVSLVKNSMLILENSSFIFSATILA